MEELPWKVFEAARETTIASKLPLELELELALDYGYCRLWQPRSGGRCAVLLQHSNLVV